MTRRLLLSCSLILISIESFAQAPLPLSPEVHSDNRATFRLRAPNAKEMALRLEGFPKPLPMEKDDQGLWRVTTDPLAPDYYGYFFMADGVSLLDPSNHVIKPSLLYPASVLHIPGPASLPWEQADVPRGQIHQHFYRSAVVGDDRNFFVYTPPGYDPRGKKTYPVLYLLHGFSDDASAWTSVGRANVIFDNLIAWRKVVPMLVVMPLGYGAPEVLVPHEGTPRDPALTKKNHDKFRQALLTEVLPRVEAAYLVTKDRNSRAIAGLSMGGAESLVTGLNSLDLFAWIGAFSSGGFSDDFEKDFPALGGESAPRPRLLWVACGTDDRLIEINRRLDAWLTSKSVAHTDVETPGYHTWMVWRRNLAEFAPLLFR